jgi:hypothetical protein
MLFWRILWPSREQVNETWLRLRNCKVDNLYSLPREPKSKVRSGMNHVARMRDKRMSFGKPKGKTSFKNLSVRESVILKRALKKLSLKVCNGTASVV